MSRVELFLASSIKHSSHWKETVSRQIENSTKESNQTAPGRERSARRFADKLWKGTCVGCVKSRVRKFTCLLVIMPPTNFPARDLA